MNNIKLKKLLNEEIQSQQKVNTNLPGQVSGILDIKLYKNLAIAGFNPTKFTTIINMVKSGKPLNNAGNKILADVFSALLRTDDDMLLSKIFSNLKRIRAK